MHGEYTGVIFPDSLLRTSKFQGVGELRCRGLGVGCGGFRGVRALRGVSKRCTAQQVSGLKGLQPQSMVGVKLRCLERGPYCCQLHMRLSKEWWLAVFPS